MDPPQLALSPAWSGEYPAKPGEGVRPSETRVRRHAPTTPSTLRVSANLVGRCARSDERRTGRRHRSRGGSLPRLVGGVPGEAGGGRELPGRGSCLARGAVAGPPDGGHVARPVGIVTQL